MVSAVVRLDIARFQGGRSFNDVHNVINTDIFMVYVRRILTTLDTEGPRWSTLCSENVHISFLMTIR